MIRIYNFAYFSVLQSHKKNGNVIDYYKSLRIHKNKTFTSLVNNLILNQALKLDVVVDNGPQIINSLYYVFGKRLATNIINQTIGKVFCAGENIESVERKILEQPNMNFILDFCSEAMDGIEDQTKFFDENCQTFRETSILCSKFKSQNVVLAVKISSLIEKELLMKITQARNEQLRLFRKILSNNQESISVQDFVERVQNNGILLTKQDVDQLNQMFEDSINQISLLYKIQPIYMYDVELNQNTLVKKFLTLNKQEQQQFHSFVQRIDAIMEPTYLNKTTMWVDAEQSYLQLAIDSFSQQMESKYNKEDTIVLNTFQNYLKSTGDRIDYEIEKAKQFGLPICAKMVRGAYIVEETKLSKEKNTDSPINDGFDATTQMYERNIKLLIQNAQNIKSNIFVASHNEETVNYVKELLQKSPLPPPSGVKFAQLYGLSDHLTYQLLDEGYNIYKLLPFGRTEIMIPYLMRRAQEAKKMLQSNGMQTVLLWDEIRYRLHLK
ncbi:hypothetical protein pb186bvf_018911 [Paramecium bursaria]